MLADVHDGDSGNLPQPPLQVAVTRGHNVTLVLRDREGGTADPLTTRGTVAGSIFSNVVFTAASSHLHYSVDEAVIGISTFVQAWQPLKPRILCNPI